MYSNIQIIIEPKKSSAQYWTAIWAQRELLFFLAWRDILVRYKQTIIGILWSVLRPLLTMFFFTIVFNKLAGLESGKIPYPVMVLAGVVPWQFFSSALVDSSNSLLSNSNMVSKIYFPRLILPMSAILGNLVDFLISFILLLLLMAFYKMPPTWHIILVVPMILLTIYALLGFGFWFSALNARYRDFRYIVPFMLQMGLFVSPIGFSSEVVPEKWRILYSMNPMVSIIDGFRWVITAGEFPIIWSSFFVSFVVMTIIFYSGLKYFQKAENNLADVI